MTTTVRKPGRRYSREQTQEDLSEAQLRARLAEVGWPSDRVGRDLGEDLHVRIYDDGASTGLEFHVQLKSTADSGSLRRKRSPDLAYKLEVKDLKHWEVSVPLVVLVVWDVAAQTGWWRPIPEIIKELEASGKTWRKKSMVAVSVPLANKTDNEGLKRLRWAVADYSLPLIPSAGPIDIRLGFPITNEGMVAFRALEHALDTGETVDVDPRFVAEVKDPRSRRLYGDEGATLSALRLTPIPTRELFPVRIDIDSTEGSAALQYAELRATQQGRRLLLLTNEHQPISIHVRIEYDRVERSARISFSITEHAGGVYNARDVAAFELALQTPGATMRITELRRGATLAKCAISVERSEGDLKRLRDERAFFDKLCYIQQRVSSQGTLSIEKGVSPDDVRTAESVFQILSSGHVNKTLSLSMSISPGPLALMDPMGHKTGDFVLASAKSQTVKLLGCDIDLGRVRLMPLDPVAFLRMYQSWHEKASRTGKQIKVSTPDIDFIEEYPDWVPEDQRWERLCDLASPQDGYCTLSQTRWVGYTDEIFYTLIHAGKVRQIDSGVFHLTHFPRSDHEDLIALWLQTDKKGVLSHDTALFLHDLSDILPRRRHVTVPPGFAPTAGALGPTVVLHHAEVDASEIRWLGPVPYTAPLRTLRDCIASHLSPDLIEQAVAEGLRRGMFTEAELPTGAHRGAT